jgi:TIR domain
MAKRKTVEPTTATDQSKFGVFLSWSGDQSRQIAEAIGSLIPNVFQNVQPFVSSNNIDAGSTWFAKISTELALTEFGIICLTPDNLQSQWIHFEAGALAKRITNRERVVPYLHGLSPSNLSPPLSLFQSVNADKTGTLALLRSLNDVRIDTFEQARLETIFEKWWPEFEQRLKSIPPPSSSTPAQRSERDLLQEVLSILRAVQAGGQLAAGAGLPRQHETVVTSGHPSPKESLRVQLLLRISELEMLALEEKELSKKTQIGALIYTLKGELNSRLM